MDEQTFIPPTMRAVYHRPASTAITDLTALDAPRVDSGMIFDTDFPTPKPAGNQYLIKVMTAGFSHDELRLSRTLNPSKSIPQIPLHNFCGIIISTPTETHYRPGGPKFKVDDIVFGLISSTRDGAAADYVVATQDEIAFKPRNISAAEAAAIPLPALTAWQALFAYAKLSPGKHPLSDTSSPSTSTSSNASPVGTGTGSESETDSRFNTTTPNTPPRILITNTPDNEVGIQALQLLRSPSLFPPSSPRPWIILTGSPGEPLPSTIQPDEVIDAALPLSQDFSLAQIFRDKHWPPVDIVLDCAGRQMFELAHSRAVVREGGTVLSAVDDTAALLWESTPSTSTLSSSESTQPGAGVVVTPGIFSRFVAVKPDGEALARIAQLVEEGSVHGRVQSIVDLVNTGGVLASGAAGAGGGRRGGMMVVRVNL